MSDEVRAVERALAILEALARGPAHRSVASIYRELGLSRSTAYRLMQTLKGSGWVIDDPETGHHRLGFLPSLIGQLGLQQFPLRQALIPFAVDLAEASGGHTVRLYVRVGAEKAAVLELPGHEPPLFKVPVAWALPLHRGPVGRLLFANLPPAEQAIILDELRQRPDAPADEAGLRADLARLRGERLLQVFEGDQCTIVATFASSDGHARAVSTIGGPAAGLDGTTVSALEPTIRAIQERATVAIDRLFAYSKLPSSSL